MMVFGGGNRRTPVEDKCQPGAAGEGGNAGGEGGAGGGGGGGGEGGEGGGDGGDGGGEGQWGPWAKATVAGDRLHLSGGPRDGVVWERNMTLQVEALPEYRYDEGTEVRLLRGGAWIRCTLDAPHKSLANLYSAVVGGAAEEAVELTSRNHAPLLDVTMDLASEYLKYGGWIRSTYSFVVDALSGERLDIMLQCVKLKVDGSGERSDAFEVVMREVCSEVEDARPVLVIGEAASGKSTFARLFLVMCIQRQQLGLVPFLIPTIDLVRLIKQNDLTADYLDGYLRAVYGPSSRRYLFRHLSRDLCYSRLLHFLLEDKLFIFDCMCL